MEKGAEAKAEIESSVDNAKLTLLKLDLADLQSIEDFVESFNQLEIPLNILINNAGKQNENKFIPSRIFLLTKFPSFFHQTGIMAIPYKETNNGFEMQFGVSPSSNIQLFSLTFVFRQIIWVIFI